MKCFMKKLITGRMADLAGTDAHDVRHRRPEMRKAYGIVRKYTDEAYADLLFNGNADILCRMKEE